MAISPHFVEHRLITTQEEGDQEAFTELLTTIKKNLSNALELGRMSPYQIDAGKIKSIRIENLL